MTIHPTKETECPECDGSGKIRGYKCRICCGTGLVDEVIWENLVDEHSQEQQRYEAEARKLADDLFSRVFGDGGSK
jgi:RecJ-like exonuclease